MTVTKLTHQQLVLQRGVGEDHHLWTGREVEAQGRITEEAWCEVLGSPEGFAGSALSETQNIVSTVCQIQSQ